MPKRPHPVASPLKILQGPPVTEGSLQSAQPCLPAAFFRQSAAILARKLIGTIFVHHSEDGMRAGRIVETEAYDETDPASHSFRGPTPRTQVMFGPGGYAYVYRSYGLHWCINVSCGPKGFGAAVLIRAVEPIEGLAQMAAARGLDQADDAHRLRLCRGPGNLTQAFGLTHGHNGHSMRSHLLGLYRGAPLRSHESIAEGPRVGISVAQETLWRFYIAGCPYVSGRRGRKLTASRPA